MAAEGLRPCAVGGKLGGIVKAVNQQERGPRGGGSGASRIVAVAIAAAAVIAFSPGGAQAARHARHHIRLGTIGFAPALVTESIVLDADTGRVLSELNADAITYPASLTKMMTLYLTFEALNTGRLRLDQYLPVSVDAAAKPPTKLGLRPGDSVDVQDLILGIVTRSANDAAAVLAEGIAGSEPAFADQMDRKAQQLGMRNTSYRNASGLPDPEQHTTARDTAQLALALYHDYPREYRYFATREFNFRGRIIVGHDHLLDWYPGADGIKTGYIRASGFNLATSAVRDGHRLVGVVLGGPSGGISRPRDGGIARPGICLGRRRRRDDDRPRARAPWTPSPIVAAVDQAPPPPSSRTKPGLLGKAAARLAAHLSPVGKAEAAVLPRQAPPRQAPRAGPPDRWGIQLGAFHGQIAAEKAARVAESLPVAKGKPLQIVEPGKAARPASTAPGC